MKNNTVLKDGLEPINLIDIIDNVINYKLYATKYIELRGNMYMPMIDSREIAILLPNLFANSVDWHGYQDNDTLIVSHLKIYTFCPNEKKMMIFDKKNRAPARYYALMK